MMNKQAIDGILLVNKPEGYTSNAVLQQVKRLLHAKKAGHTGSLDPLATGMLPICFGDATKLCQYLLDANKHYEVTGLLGVKTTTSDSMGDVLASVDQFEVTESQLRSVLLEFTGPIQQVPSMFSALKHKGTPLYKYARSGVEIERQARGVMIYDAELRGYDGRSFKLAVSCSKGTYIRNLVEDIGERLGVHAHVTQLHRTYTAGFEDDAMYTLDELVGFNNDELMHRILPMDRAVHYLPSLVLDEPVVLALRQGKEGEPADWDGINGLVRLYNLHHQFIGLGEILSTGILKSKRLCQWS